MIAFNKYYNKFNILSISLVVISLLLLIFKGLNFGIDFKGGTLIELRSMDSKINVSSLRDNLNQMNLGDISVKNFWNKTDFLIKVEINDNKNVIENIKKSLEELFYNNENQDINNLKVLLATQATAMLHGKKAAENSEQAAKEVFSGNSLGSNLPLVKIKSNDLDKKINIFFFY